MANAIQLYSEVTNGHIDSSSRQIIANALRMLDGHKVEIVIRERKKRRSLSQNAFYWGVVIPIVTNHLNEYGANIGPEEAHDFLKQEVMKLRSKVALPDGSLAWIIGSSTKLTTSEWEVAIDKIRAWAAEIELIIPFPNEYEESYVVE